MMEEEEALCVRQEARGGANSNNKALAEYNTAAASSPTLNDLPEEILLHVLRFLAIRDLATASLLNRTFYRIASDISLWRPIFDWKTEADLALPQSPSPSPSPSSSSSSSSACSSSSSSSSCKATKRRSNKPSKVCIAPEKEQKGETDNGTLPLKGTMPPREEAEEVVLSEEVARLGSTTAMRAENEEEEEEEEFNEGKRWKEEYAKLFTSQIKYEPPILSDYVHRYQNYGQGALFLVITPCVVAIVAAVFFHTPIQPSSHNVHCNDFFCLLVILVGFLILKVYEVVMVFLGKALFGWKLDLENHKTTALLLGSFTLTFVFFLGAVVGALYLLFLYHRKHKAAYLQKRQRLISRLESSLTT